MMSKKGASMVLTAIIICCSCEDKSSSIYGRDEIVEYGKYSVSSEEAKPRKNFNDSRNSIYEISNGNFKYNKHSSVKVPGTYTYMPKVKDVTNDNMRLDIYSCNKVKYRQGCETVVYIHGGGLMRGDKKNIQSKPSFFNRNGYCFVSVNYPIYGKPVHNMVAQQVDSIYKASKWLNENMSNRYNQCSPNNMSIMGHSAGGYLVSLLLVSPDYSKVSRRIYRNWIINDTAWLDMESIWKRKLDKRLARSSEVRSTNNIHTIMKFDPIGSALGIESLPPTKSDIEKVRALSPIYNSGSMCTHNINRDNNVLVLYQDSGNGRREHIAKAFSNSLGECIAGNVNINKYSLTHKQMNKTIGEDNKLTSDILEFMRGK